MYFLAALFAGVMFTSCNKEDVESNLLGKWSLTSMVTTIEGERVEQKLDGNNYMFITFASEGRYIQDVNAFGERWSGDGTWVLEIKKLILDKGTLDEQVFNIQEINANKLTMDTRIGSQPAVYYFSKVK